MSSSVDIQIEDLVLLIQMLKVIFSYQLQKLIFFTSEVVSSKVEIRIEDLVLAFVGGQSQIQLKFFKQAAE